MRAGASAADDPAQALLAQMTMAEKIGQLNLLAAGEGLATGAGSATPLGQRLDTGRVGAIFGTKSLASAREMQARALAGSRLGIPLFFAEDVIHGHRTVFPLPVALACSWNMDLVGATAAHAAAEAAAEGLHQVFAPMLDVSRDPRWGRVAESPGEDPLLASRIAVAMTRGLQGGGIAAPGNVAACLKHFVAYGATDSGRDYDNASLAWEDLLGIYLPPFVAGIEAGAASVMVGFNAVNKVPMHANFELVEQWLRGRAGFDGLVVSDYTGVKELVAHGLGDPQAVVARALLAGIDMDMVGEDYLAELPALVEDGIDDPHAGVTLPAEMMRALVDRACYRVLAFKAALGLLEDPFSGMGDREAPPREPGYALARRAAAESAVLLANDGVLPLASSGRVALIGPFAEDRANMLGTWAVSGDSRKVQTLRAAFEARDVDLAVAWGANIVEEGWLVDRLNVHGVTVRNDPRPAEDMIAEAVAVARAADVAVVAIGEAKEHAGESSSRLAADVPAPQRRLVEALAGTGTPLVVLVFAARPLVLGAIADQAQALIYAWHGGTRGPDGVADLIFGDAEPSGRLAVTLPVSTGEVPLSYAAEPTGRPDPGRFVKFRTGWLDLADGTVRFPFGYGLGYGEVRYGRPQLDAPTLRGERAVARLAVEIENRGPRPMTETVQLYLTDPVARITRPGRTLCDFRQVRLAPGEAATVRFEVTHDMLRYPVAPSFDAAEWVWDPGRFVLHVGPNSRDTQSVDQTWEA